MYVQVLVQQVLVIIKQVSPEFEVSDIDVPSEITTSGLFWSYYDSRQPSSSLFNQDSPGQFDQHCYFIITRRICMASMHMMPAPRDRPARISDCWSENRNRPWCSLRKHDEWPKSGLKTRRVSLSPLVWVGKCALCPAILCPAMHYSYGPFKARQ